MKNIIVLGGGTDQIDLIVDLKSRGFYTILLDYNTEPAAKNFANKHIQISTLDQDAVLEIAKKYNVDRIITACTDQALLTMGYVADQLHLPCFLSFNKARNITNKRFMKTVMRDNNIPTSNFKIITEYSDSILSELKPPLIVKPVDCNSSKGVVKVQTSEEAIIAINNAVTLSRSGEAIIEEFVSGKEVSIDAYITKDNAQIIMVGELIKANIDSNTQLIIQNIIPANISAKAFQQIAEIAHKISKAFDLNNTPLLIQAIVNGDNVNVIEFSARLGGGCKHHTIKAMTGFDIMKANVDSLLGEYPEIPAVSYSEKIVSRLHIYLKPGTLATIEGLDQLNNSNFCEEVIINKAIGSVFTKPKASTDRLGSILFTANSINELNLKISKALNILRFMDIDGQDMLYTNLYKEYLK